MKLLNFTIIKFTACLIIGILTGHYFNISVKLSIYISASFLIVTGVAFFIAKRQFYKTIWFGLSSFFVMISFGIMVSTLHDQKNSNSHYTHVISEEKEADYLFTIRIRERLKPNLYYDKYIANVLQANSSQTSGKILLNLKKDSLPTKLTVDDIVLSSAKLKPINRPLNPHQFDYAAYLQKQYIYYQISVETKNLQIVNSETSTIFGYAANLRNTINKKLKAYNFKTDELAIINALLLGQRQDMSKNVYQNFTNAGAVHILAVSGLHIGLILLILNVLFKPLERIKHGRIIKSIILVLLLWSYAVVAGLSASVTRAVMMFSIIAIAINLKRPTNIYNTLAISMFVLLLTKPMFLFDVGFQLSYIAVLAIVTLQPMLYRLWRPRWKLTDYFWQILTVTIAAQIGVAPISIFYFHQFPSLFFISNLAIIPFLGLILGLGIGVIVLALLNCLPVFLAEIYSGIISLMNGIVTWVSQQELFLFKNISLDIFQMLAIYLLLIFTVVWLKKPQFKRLVIAVVCLLIVQATFLFQKFSNSKNGLIIFHKSRYTLIGEKTNSNLLVSHNLDSLNLLKDRIITNYCVGNFMRFDHFRGR